MSVAAALEYAGRGWPVFPISWDGKKHPLIKHWGSAASTDPAAIAAWWRRWPKALIGVPTGQRSGFIVLDIDIKNPSANGFDTLADLGCSKLPDTPIAHTRSGGVHLYFGAPEVEIRNSIGKHGLGPGLDVRGEGGFVVVPCPGSGYSWDPHWNFDTVALHRAPAWLGHRTRQRSTAAMPQTGRRFDPQTVLEEACNNIRNARDGDKYRTIRREPFIVACLVRDRLLDERTARHELDAALLCLGHRVDDYHHMLRAYEGAFAEGLAAPRRAWP